MIIDARKVNKHTTKRIREEWGTVAHWCRKNGFKYETVKKIATGEYPCKGGSEAQKIIKALCEQGLLKGNCK